MYQILPLKFYFSQVRNYLKKYIHIISFILIITFLVFYYNKFRSEKSKNLNIFIDRDFVFLIETPISRQVY